MAQGLNGLRRYGGLTVYRYDRFTKCKLHSFPLLRQALATSSAKAPEVKESFGLQSTERHGLRFAKSAPAENHVLCALRRNNPPLSPLRGTF
jgi:hypothetical protein